MPVPKCYVPSAGGKREEWFSFISLKEQGFFGLFFFFLKHIWKDICL